MKTQFHIFKQVNHVFKTNLAQEIEHGLLETEDWKQEMGSRTTNVDQLPAELMKLLFCFITSVMTMTSMKDVAKRHIEPW